ncbi:MAG: TetR/AcrR family transcriptional regulator [Bacillota bacterium]
MEDLAKLSRKEREKLIRKHDIQRAAAKLFSEKGFSNTTLEDIAVSSEFGIGTIYNYFQSKEEIFRSIIEAIFDANFEIMMLTDKEAVSLREFLSSYTRRIFEYFSANKEALLLLVSYFTGSGERPVNLKHESFEPKHCQMDERIIERIKKGMENNEIRKLNAENLYYYYHSLVFPYITNLIRLNKLSESNTAEHADFVLDVLFNGISINKTN